MYFFHTSRRQAPSLSAVIDLVFSLRGRLLAVILLLTASAIHAPNLYAQPFAGPQRSAFCFGQVGKQTFLEARFSYFWGWHEIWLRDGDNYNIPPSKREITLNSLAFGAQGETFLMNDLEARGQFWINVPAKTRNDFWQDATYAAWDTRPLCLGADLSLIYHLGLGGMPYTAGLVAGYRYNRFDYSGAPASFIGDFQDELNVHIPYLGVHYAHSRFNGSVVSLDILTSPFTLAEYDGRQNRGIELTTVDGNSMTGLWFEMMFGWRLPLTENVMAGIFTKYNYLELSGGATVKQAGSTTHFSMDSRQNLIFLGISASYSF